MTTTASAQIVIRENTLKFGWCHSNAPRHFRQIYCYVGGKGFCCKCASALRLKVVDSYAETQPVEVKKNELPKKKARLKGKDWSELEEDICRYLKNTCLSSKELYRMSKDRRSYNLFTNFLRQKVNEGILVADRRKSHQHMVYTVAANLDLLQRHIGQPPVEEQILLALKDGSLGIREIVQKTQKTRPTVYSAIKRLKTQGLISTTLEDSGKGFSSLLCSLVGS